MKCGDVLQLQKMAILPTSNPLAQNRIDLLATKNKLEFQLGGLGEASGTTKQAIVFVQSQVNGPFNLPLNEATPLIAINYKASYDWDLSSVMKNAAIFSYISIPPDDFNIRNLQNFIVPFQVQTF